MPKDLAGGVDGGPSGVSRPRPIRRLRGESPLGRAAEAGSRVSLQEQPFRILARLIERPGELLTREELRQELWPADTFVDFHHGLNAAVKRLREAIGDSADNPQFIETIPRRGSRFIAPVQSDVPSQQSTAPAGHTSRHAVWSPRWLVAVVVSAVAVAAPIAWRATRRPPMTTSDRLVLGEFENTQTIRC